MEITRGLSDRSSGETPEQNENWDPDGVDILSGDELVTAS